MYLDVVDLMAFYDQPLGQLAHRRIGSRLSAIWPDAAGARLLGFGYATPYLTTYLQSAERIAAFMPAAQGVVNWPQGGKSATVLVQEELLPLPDASFDKALVVHSLENTNNPLDLMREIWRVLAPGGRIVIIVPNRRGLWSRVETTPLGFGRPFSRGQLTTLLRECLFVPNTWATALHVPPFSRNWLIRSAGAWDRVGARLGSAFAGVLLVEATKQLYQGVTVKARRRLVPSLRPVLVPQRAPVTNARSGLQLSEYIRR